MSIDVRPVAITAVTLRGYSRAEGDPARMATLVARVHQLLAVHAEAHGGAPCPTGLDIGIAQFGTVDGALSAAIALVDEVEAARDPESHRHHGLLGVGISFGPVLVDPRGVAGVAVARATRLAVWAELAGEIALDEVARRSGTVPVGWGASSAPPGERERLGFGFVRLADYR